MWTKNGVRGAWLQQEVNAVPHWQLLVFRFPTHVQGLVADFTCCWYPLPWESVLFQEMPYSLRQLSLRVTAQDRSLIFHSLASLVPSHSVYFCLAFGLLFSWIYVLIKFYKIKLPWEILCSFSFLFSPNWLSFFEVDNTNCPFFLFVCWWKKEALDFLFWGCCLHFCSLF